MNDTERGGLVNDDELADAVDDEHWPNGVGGCDYCDENQPGEWPCKSRRAAARIRELTAEVERLGTELNDADTMNGEVMARCDRLLAAIENHSYDRMGAPVDWVLWNVAAEVRAEMMEGS